MWTFYILYSCSANKYYIGVTGDNVTERLRRHNTHHKGFTGKTNDWEIIYTEKYQTKNEAYSRERQVKKWKSRKLIQQLVSSAHPGS
ncbi:GIY-YIG nuclease family protein [Agriterribacter sp.]|uniref:GIY-YIG nuclease family protein n=1 Tax=Agriterribacter sp. TaxID=2821509 RepID=UPI002B645F90|nr:GIY-YIG nuclease family protein [Agriterribacter sp.]HTN07679.1 GIY-YIG nuclease family protein [Agriterribacter sp.]